MATTYPTTVEGADAGYIWLGRHDTTVGHGYLRCLDVVRESQLAQFARRTTIGPADKDSDDYISTLSMGDWTGGGQIETINEQTDAGRNWYSLADTRAPNKTGLPPLIKVKKPSSGVSGTAVYPLGDIPDTNGRMAIAWGTTVRTWNEGAPEDFYAATGTALSAAPVNPGTRFNTILYVPLGATGYAEIVDGASAGDFAVTNRAASATIPGAVDFCVNDNRLYALASDGQLWQNVTGVSTDWDEIVDHTGLIDAKIDTSRTPRRITSYFNKEGISTLFLITDKDVFMFDPDTSTLQLTNVQIEAPLNFGRGVAVWRSGEDLWITNSSDIVRYTSAGVIVPNSGLARDDGLPSTYRGYITSLAGQQNGLFALVFGSGTYTTSLWAWFDKGWHGLYRRETYTPTWLVLSTSAGTARLWWGETDGEAHSIKFPADGDFLSPKQRFLAGDGNFAAAGEVVTGRFDASMLGFDKIAERMVVFPDNATAAETLIFSYRTEADGDGAYRTLGTVSSSAVSTMYFDPDGDGHPEGLRFNWIQFKMAMARGGTVTNTPLLNAANLHFYKIPQNAVSHTIAVELPAERINGRSAKEIYTSLRDYLAADELIVFVHKGEVHNGIVVSVSVARWPNGEESGQANVSYLSLRQLA